MIAKGYSDPRTLSRCNRGSTQRLVRCMVSLYVPFARRVAKMEDWLANPQLMEADKDSLELLFLSGVCGFSRRQMGCSNIVV